MKRVVVGIAATLLLGFLYVVGDRQLTRSVGNRELAQARAEADASDPNWRWDDLNRARKRPPEGKNSADVIDPVKQASPKGFLFPDVPDSRLPNHEETDEAVAELRRQLALAPEAVRLARSLKDYPSGFREVIARRSPLDTYVENTQQTRWAAAVLIWDSRVVLFDGNLPLGTDNIVACLNATRSIGDEPDAISQIVRAGVRVVATHMLERALARSESLPRLVEIQALLAADAEESLLYHTLRGTRATIDLIFEGLENGTLDRAAFIDEKDWTGRFRSGLPANRATMLRRMTLFVEEAKLPAEQQGAAFARNPWPIEEPNRLMASLQMLAANLSESQWRSTASMRSAVAGIACERFRLINGRWPKTLKELPADILPAEPLDPFDGNRCATGYSKTESRSIPSESTGSTTAAISGGTHLASTLASASGTPPPAGCRRFRLRHHPKS